MRLHVEKLEETVAGLHETNHQESPPSDNNQVIQIDSSVLLIQDEDGEVLTEDDYLFKHCIEDLSVTTQPETVKLPGGPDEHSNQVTEEAAPKPIDDNDIICLDDDHDDDDDDEVDNGSKAKLKRELKLPSRQEIKMRNGLTLDFKLAEENVSTPCTLRSLMRHVKDPNNLSFAQFDNLIATVQKVEPTFLSIKLSIATIDTTYWKMPIECGICHTILSRSEFSMHLKCHQHPITKRYFCSYCNENYACYKYLAGHIREFHLGIFPYICAHCNLVFPTKDKLYFHVKHKHWKINFPCEFCTKSYTRSTTLNNHYQEKHASQFTFQCSHCPNRYHKKSHLTRHLIRSHKVTKNEPIFPCEFCEKKFKVKAFLNKHRKDVHLNQIGYLCHACCEAYLDIKFIYAHKRTLPCRTNTRIEIEKKKRHFFEMKSAEIKSLKCVIDQDGNFIGKKP